MFDNEIHSPASRINSHDGGPVFSQLGTIDDDNLSMHDAVKNLLGRIRYTKEPAYTFNARSGKAELLPGQYHSIMRDPGNEKRPVHSFGVVTEHFNVETPLSIARILGPVLSDYTVSTIGIIKSGSKIFCALKAGEQEIVGEPHTHYLVIEMTFKPGEKYKVYLCTVRHWCWNVQVMAEASAKINLSISHSGNVKDKLKLAAEFVKGFEENKTAFANLMDMFVKYDVNGAEIDAAINAAFSMPSRPKILTQTLDQLSDAEILAFADSKLKNLMEELNKVERGHINSMKRIDSTRELALDAVKQFDIDFPHFKGTAYSVYNAITQTCDWKPGKGNVAEAAMAGDRMRDKIAGATFLTELVTPEES